MIHTMCWQHGETDMVITTRYYTGTVAHYNNRTVGSAREADIAIELMEREALMHIMRSFLNQRIVAYNKIMDHVRADKARVLYGIFTRTANCETIKGNIRRYRADLLEIMPPERSMQASWIPIINFLIKNSVKGGKDIAIKQF